METTIERRRPTRTKPKTMASAGCNFLALDFETANYERDSACSIGLVKVVGSKIIKKKL